MSFKHNPVDEALSASKSLKILETTPTGADFDARVRITVQVPGATYLLIQVAKMLPFARSGNQFLASSSSRRPRVAFCYVKLRFFILNSGAALAIRLQDVFVRSRLAIERAQKIGVPCERRMKRPAAKDTGGTGS